MKDSGPWIALLLGIVAIACIVMGPRVIIDTAMAKLNIPTPRATATLSAGNAAAEATRVAQEQYAIMTANAAQYEMEATTQAGIVQGTRQAAEANQIHLDQEAAARAESTAQAIQATATRQAAEATGTRQAVDATAAIVQVTVNAGNRVVAAAEAERKDRRLFWESMWANLNQSLEKIRRLLIETWIPFALICMGTVYGIGAGLGVLLCIIYKEKR